MQPILDETSIVPCPERSAGARIAALAGLLKSFDGIGAARVLRTARYAADLDIGDGRGLSSWLWDRLTPREAGLFVAARLTKQPFIDGPGGLMQEAEGAGAIEATVGGQPVVGLALAAIQGGLVSAVGSVSRPSGGSIDVKVTILDGDGTRVENHAVQVFVDAKEVEEQRGALAGQLYSTLGSGQDVVDRAPELFPQLRFGELAKSQIAATPGTGPVFRQLLKHLRALQDGARNWSEGQPYEPVGVPYSPESQATLRHAKYGPQRDFPTPAGFSSERWSYHTKNQGENIRMYYRAIWDNGNSVVLVGYFGRHLDTVKF